MQTNTIIDKHIVQLDFLKFIAAIIVVLFHYASPAQHINISIKVLHDFVVKGNLAVHFFFVLSGFLLTHVELSNPSANIKSFYKKRLIRIYPLYLVALLLCVAVNFPSINPTSLLVNLFGLQQLFYPEFNELNPPSWTISQLFIFYLIFPFILKALRNNVLKYSIYILVFVILFLVSDFFFFHLPLIQNPHWVFTSFILGVSTRGILQSSKVNFFISKYHAWLIAIAIALLVYFVSILDFNYWHGSIFINITFSVIISSLCFLPKDSNTFLRNPKIAYLGNISYSIYLFQHPIYLLFVGSIENRPTVQFLVFLLILLICSWIIYVFIEKPLGSIFKKYIM